MPENIIAKKLNIELDTINQKIKVVKDFVVVIGDSVEIAINLKENNLPKNITNCVCRLIGVKENSEPFEQTEKIEIVDALNGVVKIYPRLDIFNVEGKTICCLLVEDTDETISVQRFIINVTKSMVTDLIIESREEIETLRELNGLLDIYENDLAKINQSVLAMDGLVTEKTNEVDLNFGTLKANIQGQIDGLQSEINGANEVINTQLTKAIKLSPYNVVGSNYVYMSTEILNFKAEDLLHRAFDVFLGGKLDTNSYNTSIGKLVFYKNSDRIYPYYLSLMDRSINSKTLAPMVVFNDLTSEILPTATGFRLMVKSNIPKNLNTNIDDVFCYLTPLGKQ